MSDLLLTKITQLANILLIAKQKLAVAESCTGGMLAQLCTHLSGSSAWFECGFVTYSNQSKVQMLGVDSKLINTYGAVSQQVVTAMAKGALVNSIADYSVAISGVAGPTGSTADKPVGTVYFALAAKETTAKNYHKIFSGDRQQIRQLSCQYATDKLIEIIIQ